MMNRYLSLLVVITSTGNLATAFVTLQPQSSTTGSLSSASTKYPSYRENGGEAFRTSVDRMIPNMPGANPNYRPGGNKDLEVFRERDNRFIPNMPGVNPAYRPGGRDLETFRERDDHRIPNMPGANPNYRSRSYAIRPDAPSWVNRSNDNNNKSQVVNGRPTLYDNRRDSNNNYNNQQQPYPTTRNENYYGVNPYSNNPASDNDTNVYSNYSTAAAVTQNNSGDNVYYDSPTSSSSSNGYYATTSSATTTTAPAAVAAEPNNNHQSQDDNADHVVGSAAWVDRQLATIRTMGRLAMEQELYNVHRVTSQLPNDATDEEMACYLLKARLVGNEQSSSNGNNQKKIYSAKNQQYGSTKYPSYYKGSVPRSWIDGAHIYGPRQAIAARRWTST